LDCGGSARVDRIEQDAHVALRRHSWLIARLLMALVPNAAPHRV